MRGREIVGSILLPPLIAIANVGGIGGSIILVPICFSLFGFTTQESVPIAMFMVSVACIIRFVFFTRKQRHPTRDATVIDYNLLSIMFPIVMIGSYLGVFLNLILSMFWLALLLAVILFLLTI